MDQIQHHGVKGQKWGVRRKAAGKGITNRVNSIKRERNWKHEYRTRSKMSDADLRKRVERLRLENQFAQQASIANEASLKSARRRIKTFRNLDAATGNAISGAVKKKVRDAAVKAAAMSVA